MNAKSLAGMRISYDLATLGDSDVTPDRIALFSHWFEEVMSTSVIEANAVILATVDAQGVPQAPTVLTKSFDADGLVIYTNYDSAKGHQIADNPNVCAIFLLANPATTGPLDWRG